MYKCKECGNLFEEGEQSYWEENHGETWSGCPCCQGSYEEISPCKICGSYENMDFDNGSYCQDCIENTQKKLERIISEHFLKDEIEIIVDLCEGVAIWKIS